MFVYLFLFIIFANGIQCNAKRGKATRVLKFIDHILNVEIWKILIGKGVCL